MKIAVIADWLPVFGGAEHVLKEFHELWPQAPLYTTVANRKKLSELGKANIIVSRLQKWYSLIRKHPPLLPLMPRIMEDIDLSDFDVVLSSSHAIGKGIIPPSSAVHICYCHTPMRYAWEMEKQYLKDYRVPGFMQRRVRGQLRDIRRWDLSTAKRVDHFIANSMTTQERIKRIYGRESTVIYPPVGEFFFEKELKRSDDRAGFLAVGRLVPYKRFDLLIETANRLKLQLKIAGTGRDLNRLKRLAGETVEILGFVPEEKLRDLYQSARALLFPQMEDAGVVPLEAQACGTPVIAFAKGGALDTVKDSVTGLFFADQTAEAIEEALNRFEEMQFDPQMIRDHTKEFNEERFRTQVKEIVERSLT